MMGVVSLVMGIAARRSGRFSGQRQRGVRVAVVAGRETSP